MNWLKKNKLACVLFLAAAALLVFAFWYGGGSPDARGWTAQDNSSPRQQAAPQDSAIQEDPLTQEENPAPSQGMALDPTTGQDAYHTDPVPAGKPAPVEPEDASPTDASYQCTLSISCAAVLDHMDWLAPEKVSLIPADGWILPPTTLSFTEGESVFQLLQRCCQERGIHMEFSDTPLYNSAYIEGIGNLYEFDCGELSGWTYQVNGWSPNYGCSRYQLQPGDTVALLYSCTLSRDIAGE